MMSAKRQTVIATYQAQTTDPGDDDFFVDGDYADLIVETFKLTGTSILAEAKEIVDGGWDLPYDGQTDNFTVGARVTGYSFSGKANAHGIILDDNDAGATGTLNLRAVDGKFEDNQVLTDDSGGWALVNSSTGGTRRVTVGPTWAAVTANGVGAFTAAFEHPNVTAGESDIRRVTPREFRIEYTFTAITDSDFGISISQVM